MTAVPAQVTEPEAGQAVVVHEAPPSASVATVVDLIRHALDHGVPVEALERLQAMHERAEDRAAAMEFAAALARFQAQVPTIGRDKKAKIVTKSGGEYSYSYADLDGIIRVVRPRLQREGLSFTWNSAFRDKMLHCTCVLRHVNGHRESADFALPVDNPSAMSDQQKHAAALTYARRQSLIAMLGLSVGDPDTDGADPRPITEDQVRDLEALLTDAGTSLPRFLKWAGVARLTEIRAVDYDGIVRQIKARLDRGKGAS